MRKTLLAISLLTTAPAALAEALPVTVDVIGDSVHYTGDLNADAVAKLADQVKASNGSVAKLVIDSGGGDVNVGMDLAEIVLAAELDVIVKRLCASSCANDAATSSGIRSCRDSASISSPRETIRDFLSKSDSSSRSQSACSLRI